MCSVEEKNLMMAESRDGNWKTASFPIMLITQFRYNEKIGNIQSRRDHQHCREI